MYRIANTADNLPGPHGLHYVHDASRPFAVLFNRGRSEICVGRYSTWDKAARFVRDRSAPTRTHR